ncbi:hypothetical protein [Amycolatopsis sp. NPDC004378]
MTATEERTITPRFAAINHLRGVGYGYALGRAAQGDVRVQGNDAGDFGDYYATHHSRPLDIDELFAEFIAARSGEDGAP